MFDKNGRQEVMIPRGLDPDKYCVEKGWKRISRVVYSMDDWQEFVVVENQSTVYSQ